MTGGDPGDPYARLGYRRLVAWPERIAREAPFLRKVVESAPVPRLLDLGCGPGEHARFLASLGVEVVGVDASAAQIASAREGGEAPGVTFVAGDLADLASLVEGPFGGAVCLGNTLPHLKDPGTLGRLLAALGALLAPSSPLLVQILNYDRILDRGERALPLTFRPADDGTIVFLRLMQARPDGGVLFNPCTLRWRPGAEPPLEVEATRNVTLRGWRRAELEELLLASGFAGWATFGGMREEPFGEDAQDLVILARR